MVLDPSCQDAVALSVKVIEDIVTSGKSIYGVSYVFLSRCDLAVLIRHLVELALVDLQILEQTVTSTWVKQLLPNRAKTPNQ